MYVLRVPYSKCLLVVAHEKPDAFVFDGLQAFRQFLETRVGYVIETWQEPRIHTFEVEPFVTEVDALRIIAHAHPKGVIRFFYLADGVTKRLSIKGSGPNVGIPDGEQYKLVGSGTVPS